MTCMAGRIWHGKDAAVHVEARSENDSGKCTAGTFVGARDMAQQEEWVSNDPADRSIAT